MLVEQLLGQVTREVGEERIRAILENVAIGVVTIDAQGCVVRTNAFFERMLGYAKCELQGAPLWRLTHPEDRFESVAALVALRRSGQSQQLEKRYQRRDGTSVWTRVTTLEPDGIQATGFQVALVEDLSATREAERSRDEAERYKQALLAVASHELRTPLHFLMGYASLLEDECFGALNAGQRECLDGMLEGVRRLQHVVANLLDVTHLQTGRLRLDVQPTDYEALLKDVLASRQAPAEQKGIRLDLALPALERVPCDPERIAQVIGNLLDNALRFTPAGGAVEVTVQQAVGETLTAVRDTGPGIAAEDLPKLFERFVQLDMSTTRRVDGLGLGLAISKALIEGHGGELCVNSTLGEGTEFRFSLPQAERTG